MRIFSTSDLHVDFAANLAVVEGISAVDHVDDALILAGDVAHRVEVLARVLESLRARFNCLFFVPGNHDLWVRDDGDDSLAKFHRILELCNQLGIPTHPVFIGGYHIVPLFSWYEPGFGQRGASPPGMDAAGGIPVRWADRRHCRWPEGMGPPARYFAGMNETHQQSPANSCATITFSHFVPRPDLLPGDEYLRFKELPQVAGSTSIDAQLRAAGSATHVFGHTHIWCDGRINGVRYVQHGLGYPRERRGRGYALKQIA